MNVIEGLQTVLDTLACESVGGGVIPSEPVAAQGIRGVALFLSDGRVAVVNLEGVASND